MQSPTPAFLKCSLVESIEQSVLLMDAITNGIPDGPISSDADNAQALITRSLVLAHDHLVSCLFLLRNNQTLAAAILARAAYEIGLSVLWACRTPDGFVHLCMALDYERDKWQRIVMDNTPDKAMAATIKLERDQARQAGTLPPKTDRPQISVMLGLLEKHDREKSGIPSSGKEHMLQYANVYKILSAAVHGDPIAPLQIDRVLWYFSCAQAAHISVKHSALALSELPHPDQRLDYGRFRARINAHWNTLERLAAQNKLIRSSASDDDEPL